MKKMTNEQMREFKKLVEENVKLKAKVKKLKKKSQSKD